MVGSVTKAATDETFEVEVLKNDKTVLVDFWAAWCGPCRQVAPILEEIAAENTEKLSVIKLDTDSNPMVTARYGITSLPTLAVFQNGEMIKTIVGARPKRMILAEIEQFL